MRTRTRLTLSLALAALVVAPWSARAEETTSATKCKLEDVGAPQRSQDNAAKKVTFKGKVRNAGDAVAHGAKVRFQIRGATDDFVVDDQVVATQPSDIQPGGEASFEVAATWTGVGAHGGGKEVLTREIEGCSAPRPEFGVSGSGYCELKFVGAPTTSSSSGVVTMRGEIENAGPGIARDVVVAVVKDGATAVPAGAPHVAVVPPALTAGTKGSFELGLASGSSASEGSVRIVGYDCQPAE
ncbi:MAG: hypothetical protein IPK07_04615 [Deltaproteobacteria bacterium]|nr:hypothetical protein [Deltaproteobacteria bacterium]